MGETDQIRELIGDNKELLKRLQELEDAEYELRCLEDGGVDNWSWYSEALEPYHQMLEERGKSV
jgi:hypothetical protein